MEDDISSLQYRQTEKYDNKRFGELQPVLTNTHTLKVIWTMDHIQLAKIVT